MIAQVVAMIAAESNGSGSIFLLALGPAGAGGVYWALYRYYRNTDKSHRFETETRVVAQPITGADRKVDEVHGTRRTHVDGDNRKNHRERVQRTN